MQYDGDYRVVYSPNGYQYQGYHDTSYHDTSYHDTSYQDNGYHDTNYHDSTWEYQQEYDHVTHDENYENLKNYHPPSKNVDLVNSPPMIKTQKRGVTWKDFDDGHEPCRLQLRGITRDLSIRLLAQEDQLIELRKEVEAKRGGNGFDISAIVMRERDMAMADLRKLRSELNHKAQEHALAVGEREAALREVDDLRDQYEAKKKECDTMQCDREVALLALKQSIAMKGEPLQSQRELDVLKNRLKEYEARDEEAKQECNQVKQENVRMRLMYDLDRTAATREAAALQDKLRQISKQRDEALKRVDEEMKRSQKLTQMANVIRKIPKEHDTSDDSAIIEDDAPDGQSSNSDPSSVVVRQTKMDPTSFNDVIFPRTQEPSYIEGLHQVITTDSPIKKVSDIVMKPKTSRKSNGTLIKIDEMPPAKPRKPVKTVAMSSSNSSTSSTSSSPITQLKAGSLRTITLAHPDRVELVCGKSRSRGIFVGKVLDTALSTGKNAVNVGDEVVEANGVVVSHLSLNEALSQLSRHTPANLAIRSNISGYLAARDTFYVRALFDFKALLETGLSFKLGQVLQVTDVESYENGWWQACKINGACPASIGEVPSKDRADMMNTARLEPGSSSSSGTGTSETSASSKSSYQRVRPQHLTYVRPVVLMGTLTHKFNKKLLKEPLFSSCLRYTTNKTAEGDFLRHCTKESVMTLCGEEGALIDCQRKKNEYYYTTKEAVQNVSDGGKHCVLEDASIYTVDQLQKAGLHPIVILVKCKSSHEIRSVRNCSAEHATRAISKANKLEREHLSKFTSVISGNNCEDLLRDILCAVNHHKESLWLPIR